MKNLTKTLLASLVVAVAYPVFAAGPASGSANRPAKPDMTKAEHMKAVEARFDAMDTNKDGKISAEERAAQRPGRGMGPGASAPEHSKADMLKRAEARFDAMDANKDGTVNAAERQAHRAAKKGERHHRRGPDGGPRGPASAPATK